MNDNIFLRKNSIEITFYNDLTSGAQFLFYSTLIEWRIICVYYAEELFIHLFNRIKVTSATTRTEE